MQPGGMALGFLLSRCHEVHHFFQSVVSVQRTNEVSQSAGGKKLPGLKTWLFDFNYGGRLVPIIH